MKKIIPILLSLIILLVGVFNPNTIYARLRYDTGSYSELLYDTSNDLSHFPSNKLNNIYDKYSIIYFKNAKSKSNTCGFTTTTVDVDMPANCEVRYNKLSYNNEQFDLVITFANTNMHGGYRNFNGYDGFYITSADGSATPKTTMTYKLYYAGTNVEATGYPFYVSIMDPDHTDVKPTDMSEWYWVDNVTSKPTWETSLLEFSFEDAYVVQNGWFLNQWIYEYQWDDRWYLLDVNDPSDGINGDTLIFKGNQSILQRGANNHVGFGASDSYFILIDKTVQKAHIKYYDTTSGSKVLLESKTVSGVSNATINYSTTSTINKYKNQGYALISDGFPSNAKFDNDLNKDQTYEVILNKQGSAKVRYIDKTDNNKVLATKGTFTGMPTETIVSKYTTKTSDLNAYLNMGYKVNTDPVTNTLKFTAGQTITYDIILEHKITDISEAKTVSRTINYYKNNTSGGKLFDSRTQSQTFNRTNKKDEVTGTTTYGTWSPANKDFAAVTNPIHDEWYTDDANVPKITVTQASSNSVVDIIYKQYQYAKVQYIDKTSNNEVLEESSTMKGKQGANISYNPNDRIQYYIDRGYALVENPFTTTQKFDSDSSKEQVFKIILEHTYTQVDKDTYEPDKCLNNACTTTQPEKGC